MSRSAKIIRAGDFEELDKALFVWLKQKRAQDIAVTGPLLCEKALELSKMIYGDDSSFSASVGSGDGGSVSVMEYMSFVSMVNSCLQIGLLRRALWSHFEDLSQMKNFQMTKYLTATKLG